MNKNSVTTERDNKHEVATFGAGCFWCVEAIFSSINGVLSVQSGYCGGEEKDATYMQVCSGETEHVEVLEITFDSLIISFDALLTIFFHSHNPTTLNRQGNDVGRQYRSVVFTHTQAQKHATLATITRLTEQAVWQDPIVTQVEEAMIFYPAEAYHKDYFSLHAEEPYCAMVIKPKLEKVKSAFASKLK